MAFKTPKVTSVKTVKAAFSSHPGHGNAAKTVATFQKDVVQNAKAFPSQPASVQMERQDLAALRRARV